MNRIVINPKSIAFVLVAVATLLIILSIGTQIIAYTTGHNSMYGLVPLLDLDDEDNLPTFFSGLILLFASSLLALIHILARKSEEKDRFYWATLSLGFLYMAFDEICMIHEKFVGPMRRVLGDEDLGVFYYAWVIPFGGIVIVLSIVFSGFLLRLPSKTRLIFIIAAVMYVGGAIGVELIEGLITDKYGGRNLYYQIIPTIQESLEMFGVIIFIWSLLGYIAEHCKEFYFTFDRPD